MRETSDPANSELLLEKPQLWHRGQTVAFVLLSLTLTACLFDWGLSWMAGKLDKMDAIGLLLPSMVILLLLFPSTIQRIVTALSFFLDGSVRLVFGIHFAINGVSDFKGQSPLFSLMIGCTLAALGTAYLAASIALLFSRRLRAYLTKESEATV